MRRLNQIYDRCLLTLAGLAAALCVGLSVWVTYDVVMRYFFRQPTSWSTDLSEYALVWIAFLVGPWLVRSGGHVSVDLLVSQLKPHGRRASATVASLVGALACFILAWQGAETVTEYYRRGTSFAKEWDLPQYIPYLVIPIGMFLMGLEFCRHIWRSVSGRSVENEGDAHRGGGT